MGGAVRFPQSGTTVSHCLPWQQHLPCLPGAAANQHRPEGIPGL